MTTEFQARALAFASRLKQETIAVSAITVAVLAYMPLLAREASPLAIWLLVLSSILLVLALGLSALLFFDAILFRTMATWEREADGSAAVDAFLDASRLKSPPASTRSLDDRAKGAQRYVNIRRLVLAFALACALAARYWA